MQRSDTRVWAEVRAKSEVWGSDGPDLLKEMQAAAERSMRERYRSASPARSYIMISSDEEEDDGAQEPGGRVYRTPYTGKREPTPEVELLAKPSPTPARRTNARTLRNQARGVAGTSSVPLQTSSDLHPTIRHPRSTIKAESSDHVLTPPPTDSAISNARGVPQQRAPAPLP